MDDLASRLSNRVQLTTDGHRVYLTSYRGCVGKDIDYGMLVTSCSEKIGRQKHVIARQSALGAVGKPYGPSRSEVHLD